MLTRINPVTLAPPPDNMHAHIVMTPPNARLAFIAGQVALDKDFKIIGEGRDYQKQATQCFRNIKYALDELGVGPDHITQLTIIVVKYQDALLEKINSAGLEVFGDKWPVTATTLIGADALGHSDFVVEINAVVAVPN